eukprot:2880831-Pyramimonas_sp.AAC.1
MQKPLSDGGKYICANCHAAWAGLGYSLHCHVVVNCKLNVTNVRANDLQKRAEQALSAARAPLGLHPCLENPPAGENRPNIINHRQRAVKKSSADALDNLTGVEQHQ